MRFTIRDARSEDSAAVRAIVDAVLQEYGLASDPAETDADLADLEASYAGQGGVFRVVESSEGDVVGCGGLLRLASGDAELRKMYLLPVARGHGLGRHLLGQLLAEARRRRCRRVVLETAAALVEAIGLYRSAGFRLASRAPRAARCDQVWELELPPAERPQRGPAGPRG